MNKEQADCTALISCTAEALDDEMLETLLVSAQQINLEICVKYAVGRKVVGDCRALSSADTSDCRSLKRILNGNLKESGSWEIQYRLAVWFPHVHVSVQEI